MLTGKNIAIKNDRAFWTTYDLKSIFSNFKTRKETKDEFFESVTSFYKAALMRFNNPGFANQNLNMLVFVVQKKKINPNCKAHLN